MSAGRGRYPERSWLKAGEIGQLNRRFDAEYRRSASFRVVEGVAVLLALGALAFVIGVVLVWLVQGLLLMADWFGALLVLWGLQCGLGPCG